MKSLVGWFARNHVAANLLMMTIFIGGLLTLPHIKREVFPEFSLDLITVSVRYLGAAPEEVEEGVCVRIEEAIQECEHFMKLPKAPPEGWVQLARLWILRNLGRDRSARDWDEVNRLLDHAEQATPDSFHVPVLRAEVLVAQNRVQEAEKLLSLSRKY